MITTETVLILGAGASITFGFPSGPDLITRILNTAKSSEWLGAFPTFGHTNLVGFRHALRDSGRRSIDAFLEHRGDFSHIGKLAIAKTLVPCEHHDTVFVSGETWYKYLFSKMTTTKWNDFASNRITFITYNYDRSLEHFLTTALANSYNTTLADSWNTVKKIKIIHLHGLLGEYEVMGRSQTSGGRQYVTEATPDEFTTAANSIRIIHEGDENDPALVEARQCLARAERVCFLGFGFDPTTAARLRGPQWSNGKAVHASAFRMSINERAEAFDLIGQVQFADVDCLQMIRDHFRLM